MSVILTSTPLRLQFGADPSTRAYFVVEEMRAGIESVDAGIAPKRIQLQIATTALQESAIAGEKIIYPADFFNPRIRRDLWRPGQLINADFLLGGIWRSHPMFPAQIMREPPPPGLGPLTLELGCKLAYLIAQDEPDGDVSDVELGVDTNLSTIARRFLIAGGVPISEIGLTSDWGYEVSYPIPKSDGDSYIQWASKLAEAANRVLFQDRFGVIRDRPVFDFSQSASVVITHGQDESELVSSQEEVGPPNVARVVANGKSMTLAATTDSLSTIVGPVSGIAPGLAGVGPIVQTAYSETYDETDPSSFLIVRRNTIARIAAAVSKKISPANQLITAEDSTETLIYDEKRRLVSHEVSIDYPRVAVAPEVDTNLITPIIGAKRTTTEYAYSALDEVDRVEIRNFSCKRFIFEATTDKFGEKEVSRADQRWSKVNGQDIYSASDLKNLADVNPDEVEEEEDAYRLVADPRVTPPDPRTPRPQVQLYQRPGDGDQVQLEGVCNFAHPGGNLGKSRQRVWEVYPGISEAQLQAIAKAKGALVWGRASAETLTLPLRVDMAAIDFPNWRIDIIRPERTNRLTGLQISAARQDVYLVDSMVWTHTGEAGSALLMLAWAGTVDNAGVITPPYIAS